MDGQEQICDRCGDEFFFQPDHNDVDGRCECVDDFWNSDEEVQREMFPMLLELANQGNTSAIASICAAQEHLGMEVDEYEPWARKAADTGDIEAIEFYVAEILVKSEPFEHSFQEQSTLEQYCCRLNDRKDGLGDYYSYEYYAEGNDDATAVKYLISAASKGHIKSIRIMFEKCAELGISNTDLRKVALADLARGLEYAAYLMGDFFKREKDFEQSLFWFKLAYDVAEDTSAGEPYVLRDHSYQNLQVFKAPSFWSSRITKYELLNQLANAYYESGKYLLALDTFRQMLNLLGAKDFNDHRFVGKSRALNCFNSLGLIASEEKDFDSAERYFTEGATYKHVQCINNLGWLADKRGLLAAAEYWWTMMAAENSEYAIDGLIGICKKKNDATGEAQWRAKLESLRRSNQEGSQAISGGKHLRSSPLPRLIKSWTDAERVACEWMRHFGFDDARTTTSGADGGIDVVSGKAVAQVKMEGVATPRPAVQQLFGIASSEKKLAFFFSLRGYTRDAIEWAEKNDVALFEFNYQGIPTAITTHAQQFMQ